MQVGEFNHGPDLFHGSTQQDQHRTYQFFSAPPSQSNTQIQKTMATFQ